MLNLNLHSHYQSSNQDVANAYRIRRIRQTSKATTTVLLCLCLITFGKSCWAIEKHHRQKNAIVVAIPTKTTPFISKLHNTLWWKIAHRHHLDPYILYAVALIESAKGSSQIRPKRAMLMFLSKSGVFIKIFYIHDHFYA